MTSRGGSSPTAALDGVDIRLLVPGGAVALGIAGLGFGWPRLLAWPLAGLLVWLGAALIARARQLRRGRMAEGHPAEAASMGRATRWTRALEEEVGRMRLNECMKRRR